MGTKYKIHNQQGLYFLTFKVVGWIGVLTRKRYRDILINSLKYCQKNKGLRLYAYVIMSNHVHLVAAANEGYELSNILRDFKKFTAQQILKSIKEESENRREWMLYLFEYFGKRNTNNRKYQFWGQDNHPIELWSEKVIKQKINYIHNNPIELGFVTSAIDWKYSSARNFQDDHTVLEIDDTGFIG